MKGGKFRCIRLDYIDGYGKLSYLPMVIGNEYKVESAWLDRVSVLGWIFYLGDSSNLIIRRFDNYFVSIDEYRDLQISNILN